MILMDQVLLLDQVEQNDHLFMDIQVELIYYQLVIFNYLLVELLEYMFLVLV